MKNVLIYSNLTKNNAKNATETVEAKLTELGFVCHVQSILAEAEKILNDMDFTAVIGGDGTMLSIAEKAAEKGVPLIGINTGNIGYMTEIELDELHLFNRLVSGDYKTEKRFMIEGEVWQQKKCIYKVKALNEILICRGMVSKMINTEISCDGEPVCEYRCDGVIIATPTGSTAYSLSAGGPIIDPTLELFIVSTICPHSFNNGRSVVFSPDSVLDIKVFSQYNGDIYLTSDGKSSHKLYDEDIVRIKRSELQLNMIQLKENSFYNTLHKKLKGPRD